MILIYCFALLYIVQIIIIISGHRTQFLVKKKERQAGTPFFILADKVISLLSEKAHHLSNVQPYHQD